MSVIWVRLESNLFVIDETRHKAFADRARSSWFIAIGDEVLQCEIDIVGHGGTEYFMAFERLHFGLGDFEGCLE